MPLRHRIAFVLAALMIAFHVWLAVDIRRQHFETSFEFQGERFESPLYFKIAVSRLWLWSVPLLGGIMLFTLLSRRAEKGAAPLVLAFVLALTAFATWFVAQ